MKWINLFLKLFPYIRNEGKLKKTFVTGVIKDDIDDRDFLVSSSEHTTESNFLEINPYNYVKSQGSWNSCLAHSISTTLEIMHDLRNTKYAKIPLSERFIWYHIRKDIDEFPNNVGSSMRDGLKSLKKHSISPEKLCIYDSNNMNVKPGLFAESFSKWWAISSYWRCTSLESIKKMIDLGYPIMLGIYVNHSFMLNSGEITVSENERLYGGHAITVYGYNQDGLVCINSWGKKYKNLGTMIIPYEYLDEYFIDAWTVEI